MKSNLKKLRKEAGLTLQQLSDKCGVCPSQLFELEKDTANPTLKTASSIAKALETKELDVYIYDVFEY